MSMSLREIFGSIDIDKDENKWKEIYYHGGMHEISKV